MLYSNMKIILLYHYILQIVENTAISNFAEFATDTSYPLIVQDGGFQLY